ncbi:ATP-dependent DNA helicase Q 4A [Spatholobus suberectus]|nr:ATP-dependent DNA helicase Q 4A [Spatholobus suberectus]
MTRAAETGCAMERERELIFSAGSELCSIPPNSVLHVVSRIGGGVQEGSCLSFYLEVLPFLISALAQVWESDVLLWYLENLHVRELLARIIIDKAHCKSQWGMILDQIIRSLAELKQYKCPSYCHESSTLTMARMFQHLSRISEAWEGRIYLS